jgi:hypothetical protein
VAQLFSLMVIPMRNAISALLICLVLGCAVRTAQAPRQAEASTVCLMDESEVIEIGKSLAGQMGWKVNAFFLELCMIARLVSGVWRLSSSRATFMQITLFT